MLEAAHGRTPRSTAFIRAIAAMTAEELENELKQYKIYCEMTEEESDNDLDAMINNNMIYRLTNELSSVELEWIVNYSSFKMRQAEEFSEQTDNLELNGKTS
jgi:hypothetical protein